MPVEPGDGGLDGTPVAGDEGDAWPLAYSLAETCLDWIGGHVDHTIMQRLYVQDGLGGVASFKERTAATSDAIDCAREVAQEVAGPRREFSSAIEEGKVEVVRHDAHRVDLDLRKTLLRASEPL